MGVPGSEIGGQFVERVLRGEAEGEDKDRYEEECAFHRWAILRDKLAEVNVNAGFRGEYCVEGRESPDLKRRPLRKAAGTMVRERARRGKSKPAPLKAKGAAPAETSKSRRVPLACGANPLAVFGHLYSSGRRSSFGLVQLPAQVWRERSPFHNGTLEKESRLWLLQSLPHRLIQMFRAS